MTDQFKQLRNRVLGEVRKQQGQVPAAPLNRFAPFVDTCLANLGRSRADFARQLGIEHELADAILDGLLPESEINDQMIVEIAKAINYEPNVLRIMLGRATVGRSQPREA